MLRLSGMTVAAAIFALGLLACSSGDDDGAVDRESLPENGLAESLLLTIDDFPTGWSEMPSEDVENECRDDSPPGLTGFAETGDFSSGGAADVYHQVIVMENESFLSDRFDALRSELECSIELINDGELDTGDYEYGDASFGSLSFPDFGDRIQAVRVQFRVKAKDSEGPFSEATGVIDQVVVAQGRVGIAVTATDVSSPFPSSTLEEIVGKAVDKLEAAE